jgi:hypothetical protein
MPDYPAEWRRALELLASSTNGRTTLLLLAHGFSSAAIAGLIDRGLATSTTERVRARQRTVELTRLQITDSGRKALGRQ